MDESKKPENGSLSKKHFAKFHERVQNKYAEMQKKLEKSRSIESLSSVSDYSSLSQSRNSVNGDIKDDEVFEITSDTNVVKYSVIVEDVNKCDTTTLGVYENVSVYEATVSMNSDAAENKQVNGDKYAFLEDNWNLSLDSIFESCKDKNSDEDKETRPIEDVKPTSPTKVSLRHRIGEKILAARERRKEARKKKKEKENMEKLILSNKPDCLERSSKEVHTKRKIRVASVAVAVIEATGAENDTPDKTPPEEKLRQLLYCRIRLGPEKRKTKIAKNVGHKATWQELFNMSLYDDYLMEVTMWDKDTFLGRCTIDLKTFEEETTYQKRLNLEECANKIQLFMLVTISGTSFNNVIDTGDTQKNIYELHSSLSGVGWLFVSVYEGFGLPGTPDSYCVIELINNRNQTQTEYKNSNPKWMKRFFYELHDITSILSITVFDEKKSEAVELGRVLIPLLAIENDIPKWYQLKDSTLTEPARGENPKILLKMLLGYNPIKASIRVLSPKEQQLIIKEPEFDRRVFANNIARVKVIATWVIDFVKIVKGLFEWENRLLNIFALAAWLTFWWNFEQWMLTLFILWPFILYSPNKRIARFLNRTKKEEEEVKVVDSRSLFEKVRSWTYWATIVQNDIGKLASFGESVKNLYNFSVPFLSKLAITLIVIITVILFFVPVRYILMAWGVHKYMRKIIRPNRTPNSEILDLLSRVPDDDTLLRCQELPQAVTDMQQNGLSLGREEVFETPK